MRIRDGNWYRVSLLLGAAPLLFGIAIFLLWLATGWKGLVVAGLVTIWGGVACVAVGAGVLVSVTRRDLGAGEMPRRRVWRRTIGAGTLLLANFPAALGIVAIVFYLQTTYLVTVVNESPARLESVVIRGGGARASFGAMEPGESRSVRLSIEQDGQLRCTALGPDGPREGMVDEYVTGNLGGEATVRVPPAGAFEVTHGRRWD